ncbi:trehalose-phosphatase [Mycobacterium bourgelatii]|uniref:Putative glycosyl hydrolase n=1 Tax=Mycobacterium bourgelatii TaxID=1273442 RepID=A0A7I9YS61_MYCBU|nr:trehalose-phosphatase [Mycobacterium bourgelatii]MCV6974572.1 trehalose-phosphatase [Mycobacterium bourgelatii]GFG91530.1 putative glycosyl hydrolase [Mycobacterium bourgelatii]
MTRPVTLDPRYHDAVIFNLDVVLTDATETLDSTIKLARKLLDVGIATAAYVLRSGGQQLLESAGIDHLFGRCIEGEPSTVLIEATSQLGVRPERSVVIDGLGTEVAVANDSGFALVIGVGAAAEAERRPELRADVVVADLDNVAVRAGDRRMSDLPHAVQSYGQIVGVLGAREAILFLDYDGTLSNIVPDPGAATLVEGAVEALKSAAAQGPVAILSGRDLADIRSRVPVDNIWFAGSHGFELTGPDGTYHQNEAAAAAVDVLKRAAAELAESLAAIPGLRVEHKRFAVALHYREVPPEYVSEIISATIRFGQENGLRVTNGRKVIELRPDIDWDKGATLAWIRARIDPNHSMLPVYIGDDLTDEDAFDAVRFDGIGIVVRHSEDGDRPSAAQFYLESPEAVVDFIRRGSNWLAYKHQTLAKSWEFTYEGYDPEAEKLREALCTLGNGYFATRGAAPESKAGAFHYPGTYAAGIFNRLFDDVDGITIDNESLVNLPNWLALTFRVDGGSWFDIDSVELLSYRQVLDLRGAVLTREVRFRDDAGRTSSLTQQRFVAMHMPHVAALTTTISPEDWSGTIEIRSTLDGNVTNSLVERYRDLSSNHLELVRTREISDNSVLLAVSTNQSRVPIAMAARNTVWQDGKPVPATYRLVAQEAEVGHDITVQVAAGATLTVEKVVTLFTGRDVATSEPAVDAERWLGRLGRYDELRAGHLIEWSHLWERLSIELEDFADELRILRLHLLHLLVTVSPHCADLDVGVPARGLHGEAYRGHIFWDELFIFPVLNLRLPMVTRALLGYRYRRLTEARHLAKAAGYSGAMFPWQSGSDGREESQRLHLNPRSGRWNPDASARAHHIGIAVAYNAWKFYQVTGDLAYLIDYGAEMLAEIARFWVSRATYDEDRGRYSIRGVIGPDEFHSGYPSAPYDGVDNNAYTNVMAVWVIIRALDALGRLPLPNRIDLLEKLGLHSEELAHWDDVSRRMFVPFHDGVISQFEGYDQLDELDWDGYRHKYGNIQRLDRILEAEGDDVNRYKASKQADVLMLLYLLSSDELRELLDRLGYRFTPDQIPRTVEYYLARTSHGSTLSGVVHTWVLARGNRNRALEFFQEVLESDVCDTQGGTTAEGVHLAAMAGSVDLIQRCFTGLETRGDRIVLSPNWPKKLGVLAFPIHYRGLHLHLRVSGKGAIISVDPRGAQGVEVAVECRGRLVQLKPGTTVRFPG